MRGHEPGQPVECCGWCRRPIWMCQAPACDDTPTYPGIWRHGHWVDATRTAPRGERTADGRARSEGEIRSFSELATAVPK